MALILKSRAPAIPLPVLALAAYAPDVIEVGLMLPSPRGGTGIYSHSVWAIAAGAAGGALLYRAVFRRAGALMVAAAWVLHLAADLVTGLKPLFVPDHLTGFDLYHVSWADGLIECVLVLVGCALYARRYAKSPRQRRTVLAVAAFLLALQAEFDVVLPRMDTLPWNPSLALAVRDRHFPKAQFATDATTHNPHASCT